MDSKTAQITYPDRLKRFKRNSRTLQSAKPDLMETFWETHKRAMEGGALDTKTKELIALAISVSTHCDDCIAHHVYNALKAGASKEEIADCLGVTVLMSGGTGVVYATHAVEALDQFTGPDQE